MLEGRDDLIVFSGRVRMLESIVACGNKRILREAFDRTQDKDQGRILFVADCDYDVPAKRLRPSQGIVLTRHTDRESDLARLGVVRAIVLRVVASARSSDGAANQITANVIGKAVALAEIPGQLRYIAATKDIPFRFDGLQLRRFREKADGAIRATGIVEAVRQRSSGIDLTTDQIQEMVNGTPSGFEVCHGKDLIQAIIAVLHQDYGVAIADLSFAWELFRSIEDSVFDAWEVVDRIRRWEAQTGVQLLG